MDLLPSTVLIHRKPIFTVQAREEHLDRLVKNFWIGQSTPGDGDLSTPIQEDSLVKKIQRSLVKLPSGKLQLPCLWKDETRNIPNNYNMCKRRLGSLLGSKLITDTAKLLGNYNNIFRKWEEKDNIEQVLDTFPRRKGVWYAPHFPVVKMDKETTKIRPVFDCAAKSSRVCLNNFLMQVPQVMNELVTVLHHFGHYQMAMTGNIKEMFLQIKVPIEDRDYLRFLLYRDNQLLIYQWKVHLFGKTDSPCVAMMAVFTQAMRHEEEYPEAFQTITHASLVDDMADSRPSAQELKQLMDQLTDFFPKHCAMYITKYIVNDKEMMLQLPPDDRIAALHDDATIRDVFLRKIKQPSFKILGIPRDYISDELCFDFSAIVMPMGLLDKLKILSILHSLYDP
jgi:hypothetical protein